MKKITKTNFQGLRQLFPVLEKEDMRHYVGGYSNGYWNGNWNNPYSYFDYGGFLGLMGILAMAIMVIMAIMIMVIMEEVVVSEIVLIQQNL